MAHYKVGDKVKAVPYNKIVEIIDISVNCQGYKSYNVKDNNGMTIHLSDELLEPVEEKDCYNCINYGKSAMACEDCTNGGIYGDYPSEWQPKQEKNCDTCRHSNDNFDCSQCEDFDEWEEIKIFPKNPKLLKFKELQEKQCELYELKNAKYGDSFGISVQKYGLISALTRMSDKFNRIETLILNRDSGTEDESLIDSLADISNYALMTVIEIDKEVNIE